jgi:hypothetical protein
MNQYQPQSLPWEGLSSQSGPVGKIRDANGQVVFSYLESAPINEPTLAGGANYTSASYCSTAHQGLSRSSSIANSHAFLHFPQMLPPRPPSLAKTPENQQQNLFDQITTEILGNSFDFSWLQI